MDPIPDIPELHLVGRLVTSRAWGQPLVPHRHDFMEISLVDKGAVHWWASDESADVLGGELWVTWPDEVHGGGRGTVQPCTLYWIQVALWPEGQVGGRTFLRLPASEAAALTLALRGLHPRHLRAAPDMAAGFTRLLETVRGRGQLSTIQARSALLDLLLTLVTAAQLIGDRARSEVVAAAIRLMDENIETPMRLGCMAERLGWSLSYLKARFRAEVGISPADYYRRRRILAACERLDSSDASITSVAHDLGFPDAQNFSTTFKRVIGVNPQAFRSTRQWRAPTADASDVPVL